MHPRPGAVDLEEPSQPKARGGSCEEPPHPRPGPEAWRSILREQVTAGPGGPRGAISC